MKEKIHSMNHMFAYIQKHFPAIRVQQMSEVPMKQEKLEMNVVQDKASIVIKLKGNHTHLKRLSDAVKEQEDWQVEIMIMLLIWPINTKTLLLQSKNMLRS